MTGQARRKSSTRPNTPHFLKTLVFGSLSATRDLSVRITKSERKKFPENGVFSNFAL
jgi:hypothetical protein